MLQKEEWAGRRVPLIHVASHLRTKSRIGWRRWGQGWAAQSKRVLKFSEESSNIWISDYYSCSVNIIFMCHICVCFGQLTTEPLWWNEARTRRARQTGSGLKRWLHFAKGWAQKYQQRRFHHFGRWFLLPWLTDWLTDRPTGALQRHTTHTNTQRTFHRPNLSCTMW